MGNCTSGGAIVEPSQIKEQQPCYPPRANKRKQIDIIGDQSQFTVVDNYVANTPKNVTDSCANLANYLCKIANNDLEKIRAIYMWIIRNITYDADGFFGRTEKKPTDKESVLKNRTSVCAGYANLVHGLCEEVGIVTKVISGFSKGFGFDPENPPNLNKETDHAWNAVWLYDEWRHLEATWDAGYLDENNKFKVRTEAPYYFLIDADIFIEDHFPYFNDVDMDVSKQWQLLKSPLDLKAWGLNASPEHYLHIYKLELTSHKNAIIEVNKEADVVITALDQPVTSFSAKLIDKSTGESHNQFIIAHVENEGKLCKVKVRPPKTKIYCLKLFAKTGGKHGEMMDCIVQYIIKPSECLATEEIPVPPDNMGTLGLHGEPEEFGFVRSSFPKSYYIILEKGEIDFTFTITRQVSVSHQLIHGQYGEKTKSNTASWMDGDKLRLKVFLDRPGGFQLNLFAQKNIQDTQLQQLSKFFIENKLACTPFPNLPDSHKPYGLSCSPSDVGVSDTICRNFFLNSKNGEVEINLPITVPAIQTVETLTHAGHGEIKNAARVIHKENNVKIHVQLKYAGFYNLTIFASKNMKSNTLSCFAKYLIENQAPHAG